MGLQEFRLESCKFLTTWRWEDYVLITSWSRDRLKKGSIESWTHKTTTCRLLNVGKSLLCVSQMICKCQPNMQAMSDSATPHDNDRELQICVTKGRKHKRADEWYYSIKRQQLEQKRASQILLHPLNTRAKSQKKGSSSCFPSHPSLCLVSSHLSLLSSMTPPPILYLLSQRISSRQR